MFQKITPPPRPCDLEREAAKHSHLSPERVGRFTASEIHKIMGKGTKGNEFSQTAYTYIAQKAYEAVIGYSEMGSPYNGPAAQWGIDNEPFALRLLSLQKYNGVLLHPTINLAATPDAIDNKGQTHEIKSPYTFANTTRYLQIANIDEVANTTPEYFWQVIAQIVAAKADCGFLHFYDARREIIKSICFEASQIDEHAKRLIDRLKEAETMLQSLKKSL